MSDDRYRPAIAQVPPLVRARTAGGLVYLLAWVHTADGVLARITWVSVWVDARLTWRWDVAEVPAADVDQVPGQVYTAVPRERREVIAKPEAREESWRKRRH